MNHRDRLAFIVEHPRSFLAGVLLITLFFVLQLPNLRFETRIYDLTVENLPASDRYEDFKEQFGSQELILVVARTQGVFIPETFLQLRFLSEQLSTVPGVRRVISLPEIRGSVDITGRMDLEAFEAFLEPLALLWGNLISPDRKSTVITLVLDDTTSRERAVKSVAELLDQHRNGLSLYQIGIPVVSKALMDATQKDFLRLPPITFLVICIVLLLIFRSLRGILISLSSVLLALTWTLGLMALTGKGLSMLTIIVPVFLIAVGTAYCLYVYPEFLRAAGAPGLSSNPRTASAEAAFRTFEAISFPTTLAVATTVIGLGSLLVNDIQAIRDFALFACFGVFALLVAILIFLPALLSLLPLRQPPTKRRAIGQTGLTDRFLGRVVRINISHQWLTLPSIIVLLILGCIGITQIQVETNPVDFFKPEADVRKHFFDISRDLAGSFPVNVTIGSPSEDYFENPAHLRELARAAASLKGLKGVDKAVSFTDYLKLVHYATNQYEKGYYRLPDEDFEVRMLANSFKTLLGEDLFRAFMSPDFSKANIVLRTHLSSSVEFLSLQDRIETSLSKNLPGKLSFAVTGLGVVIAQSSQALTESQVESLSITLLLVFITMLAVFLSWKVGAIAMLPNLFPIVINFGLMGWLGIPLSMSTSLVASIAIGLAVDDTIHYLVRYNQEFKKDLDKVRALEATVRHVGKPMIYTTLTVGAGFAVLLSSQFQPTAVFGLMMVITMASALVGDLILLPSLMLHVELVTLWDLLKVKLGKDPHAGMPLFKGLSRTQVHYILMAGAIKRFPAGDIVLRQGEMSDSMYAVISGELKVLFSREGASPDADRVEGQLVGRIRSGEVVGEMGMIRACRRSATVVAQSDTELLQINERMIKRLQWLYPPTAQKFFFNLMRLLCDRLESLTKTYAELSTFSDSHPDGSPAKAPAQVSPDGQRV